MHFGSCPRATCIRTLALGVRCAYDAAKLKEMETARVIERAQVVLEMVSTDIRWAWRSLTNTPGFTSVAVVTLAVGIGANAAVLSVADPMLLRPLPYPAPESLVALRSSNPAAGFPDDRTSLANLLEWQAGARLFESIAGYRWRSADLVGGDRSERLRGLFVTPEFFEVFRLTDVIGRRFGPPDQAFGSQPSIILGSGLWRRRFASDPRVIGQMLDVNTLNLSRVGPTPRLVIGVVPGDVHFPPFSADFQFDVAGIDQPVDFWTPEPVPGKPSPDARELEVVGRLRPGVTIAQAQAEMDGIARRLAEQAPASNEGWGIRVVPLRHQILGSTRRVVLLLSLCSAVVLLIACVNVATLQIARRMARQRDVAIQIALGAGRGRIFRQDLVETWLLATAAAVVAVLVTAWAVSLLRPFLPPAMPLIRNAAVDARVLVWTFFGTISSSTTVR